MRVTSLLSSFFFAFELNFFKFLCIIRKIFIIFVLLNSHKGANSKQGVNKKIKDICHRREKNHKKKLSQRQLNSVLFHLNDGSAC